MNPLSAMTAVILTWEGVMIQASIPDALNALADARVYVMGSRMPCPEIPPIRGCAFKVFARDGKRWRYCDRIHPPSGAELPMERQFRVEGSCRLHGAFSRFSYPLPAMEVFRQ